MNDVFLVARFEVLRAVRTWRALALVVLLCVASGAAAYMFVQFVGVVENNLARQLGVPETETPGAMLDQLVQSESWVSFVDALVPDGPVVDFVLTIPPLAMFHLWLGFLLVPFFAASASAECISLDVRSRAIRYEALRAGRLDIILGRLVGQIALTGIALLASSVVVWGIGVGFMLVPEPLTLLGWLLVFALRSWVFAIPFVGIGVAASQLTASAAWARVLAVGGTVFTWVTTETVNYWERRGEYVFLADLVLVFPQAWLEGFWEPGLGWLPSAIPCVAMGFVFAALGYARFARRDL